MLRFFATYILYVMAVSCKVGRPYHVADIPFGKDPTQELYDKFYAACRELCYFDTVVLSRALGVSLVTIRLWKAGKRFPGREATARLVIDWVDRGKPQRIVTQAEAAASMF
jgi:hypothetical protein